MNADEKWEERWKRLKEYIQKDFERCSKQAAKIRPGKETGVAEQWSVCAGTDGMILFLMVRLEKED